MIMFWIAKIQINVWTTEGKAKKIEKRDAEEQVKLNFLISNAS